MLSADSIGSILTTLHDAFRRRDMTTISRYFADDIRLVRPEGELVGKQARIDDEHTLFDNFSNGEIEVTTTLVNEDQAIELCIMHGVATAPPQAVGRRVALRYVVHYRFVDDKIVFQEVVFDRVALLKQLGLAE